MNSPNVDTNLPLIGLIFQFKYNLIKVQILKNLKDASLYDIPRIANT